MSALTFEKGIRLPQAWQITALVPLVYCRFKGAQMKRIIIVCALTHLGHLRPSLCQETVFQFLDRIPVLD
jgi:hypothetical protein